MAKTRKELLELALLGVEAQIEALEGEKKGIEGEIAEYAHVAEAGKVAELPQKQSGSGEWTPARRQRQALRMKKVWAKKAAKAESAAAEPEPRRVLSAATRKKMAAAQKRRWSKAKKTMAASA